MKELELIKNNKNRIQRAIDSWSLKAAIDEIEDDYLKRLLLIHNYNYQKLIKKKTTNWGQYLRVINEFTRQLNKQIDEYSPTEPIFLKIALAAGCELMQKASAHLATHAPFDQENCHANLLKFQNVLVRGIAIINPAFHINLSELKRDYEQAYESHYSRGTFSFFKLPLKRFFRQNSRHEILDFLVNVEQALNSINKTEIQMTHEAIEDFKISALNLVRFRIRTETFGNGSLLLKLIDKRLGSHKDDNMMLEDFVKNCSNHLKVEVPLVLRNCYKNDVILSK